MIRSLFLIALCAACSTMVSQASAQVILPPLPQGQGGAKEIQDFQKALQDALQLQGKLQRRQLEELLQQRPGGKLNDGSINWGGLRLTKADANLQQQLGLDEKEGLVVAAVTPNSAGDKAGLKVSDVLVKINNKSVPNDLDGFTKMVKDEKSDQAADLVVVRKGKEETIKGVKMPAVVQGNPIGGGKAGRPGIGGIGGIMIRPLPINPARPNPFQQGQITKLHLEMNVNGAKIVRKLDGDQFSGEYSKDELKITLTGKMENGQAKPGEVTVTEGKETKKYASPKDVPAQHRPILQQLLPTASLGAPLLMPNPFDLQGLPGLPGLPNLDD